MTVTSPASGARAPHRRSTRRLLATSLAALLALGTAAPAHGATPTPEPTAAEDAASEMPALSVVAASDGMLRPGEPLTLTATLTDGSGAPVSAIPVTLSLGAQPIGDRAALGAWLAEGDADPGAQQIATPALSATVDGEEATASVTVAPDDPVLAGRAPGVYTVHAAATVGGETLSARSVVTLPAEPTAPIGVVVPVTAAPRGEGLLTADELASLTAPDGDLTMRLAAVEGTTAILAVDPAIPAAIRVLGTAAPATATAWLTRLETLPNSRFALQFGDADVAAQLQAGLPAPLAPTSLLAYMRANDFAADETPAPSPTPTPSPEATTGPAGPAYPDLATLTDIGGVPRAATYWPAPGSAGPGVVTALGSLAASDTAASVTLIPSTSTATGAEGATVPAAASADGAHLLVYDDSASARLTAAADATTETARDAALAAATAELSFAGGEAGGRPLLVALDRGAARTSSGLRSAIEVAVSSSAGVPTLDALADVDPEAVQLVEAAAPTDRAAAVTELTQKETEIAEFATILDDPELLTGPQRAEILQLLGVGWKDDPEGAQNALVDHRAATAATLDAVGIVSTNVVLVSYGSEGFRPYVRNELDYPVTLTLVAASDTASLELRTERTPIRAEARSNTLVGMPIEARIANATAVVSMQLYSPTNVPIGKSERATVEVHAEWETIAIVVLSGLMALFLAGGIFRTIRRRRRLRAGGSS